MTKNVVFKFLLAPYKVIKHATELAISLFRSFHLSMRRKIAADYLAIYLFVAVVSTIVVPMIFVFYVVHNEAKPLGTEFNQIFSAYNNKSISEQDLTFKIEQYANAEGLSYFITLYKNVGLNEALNTHDERIEILTGAFKNEPIPLGFFNRLQLIISDGLITKYIGAIGFQNELQKRDSTQDVFVINAYFPLERYYSNSLFLSLLMFTFYMVGFLFMLMIGGARIKQILNPIYLMTMTAKQITISNMERRLDVENTKYELKDLAMTLNDMIDRLDKDYAKQKRFVSDVSHELRTPISIINGYASMLERWGKKDEEILDESISAIISESKNMQSLVENLLTLVRSDNQTLKYKLVRFDIGKLICEVVKEFNMVNTKNQYITCESSDNICVNLDEAKIKQTLRIFVDNAVKYTPDNGGIHVKCYERNHEVYIHVKDTGLGIAKEDLPHLFERFYRSDESRTRETGGHGLGLAIAKVLILGHNGKIQVKTRIAKGSEFIISLPKELKRGDENNEDSSF
jgi:two-component system, OmpR family, sensor histidine kinase ArlS